MDCNLKGAMQRNNAEFENSEKGSAFEKIEKKFILERSALPKWGFVSLCYGTVAIGTISVSYAQCNFIILLVMAKRMLSLLMSSAAACAR